MRKTWLVAATTYRRRVRSGMFLILTFGLPAVMVIAGLIPVLRDRGNELPDVGYVDQTGRLAPVSQVSLEDTLLNLTAYPDTAAALAAFQRGDIGGYLVIPPGYFEGEPATYFGQESPGEKLEDVLAIFMRQAVLPDQPMWLIERLQKPSQITYVARDSDVEATEGPTLILRIAFPSILALLFVFAVFTGASQMGSAMVREKDQRAMEIIITSLAPRELVAGKVLGMSLLSLTQVAVWAIGGLIAAGLALSNVLDFQSLSIPWRALVWSVLLGVPGYYLYAVLASGLGVIAGESQQAQQLAGFLGFVSLVPLWLIGQIVEAPDGPLAIALTLFPLTGPLIGLVRMSLTDVPTWQLAGSLALITTTLAGSIWIVARIFRAAMLMYGKVLRPGQIVRALREA